MIVVSKQTYLAEELSAWLLERIAEDERWDARFAEFLTELAHDQGIISPGLALEPGVRSRAKAESKRRIVAHCMESIRSWQQGWHDSADRDCAITDLVHVLKLMGLHYADRAGYREEWKP